MKQKDKTSRHGLTAVHLIGAARLAAVFAVTLLLLWLLLLLSATIPNAAIRENMERSALSYRDRPGYEFAQENQFNTIADHYADVIWLNVAWNVGEGEPLSGSLCTNYYDGGDMGEAYGLFQTVTEGTAPNTDYTRYWHGTVIFLRLFHLFTDVEGVKLIGFCALLLLILLSCALLTKRGHGDLALLLLLSLAAVRFWNLRLSVEYQPSFLVAFAMLPLFLLWERRNDRALTVLSTIAGTAVAFFDFLTTETVTILLPLMLVIAVRAKEGRLGAMRDDLLLLLRCGAAWGLSYVAAFPVKWAAAGAVSGAGVFSTALASVGERIGGVKDFTEPPDSFLSAPLSNLNMLFGGPARVNYAQILIGCGLALLLLLSVWYLLRGKEKQTQAAILLLMLGALVLLRYLVLNNHSYLHCFFTYRALVSLIFALTASVLLNIRRPKPKKERRS